MRYIAKQVLDLTGLTEDTLKDLTRKHGKMIRFKPDFPTKKRGSPSYYSERDIEALKEYVRIRRKIIELQNETKSVLNKENL